MEPHFRYKILQEFCEKNEIQLIGDYCRPKIAREDKIYGYCTTPGCDGTFNCSYRQLTEHDAFHCHGCTQEIRMEKTKKTNLKKYKVEYAFQSEKVKKKIVKTNIKKYGKKCALSNPAVREKGRVTLQAKYGVDNAFQSPVIKQKIKDKFMAEHKVEYTSQIPGVRDKARATMKERFGHEYATQSPELLEKTKKTNLAKYNTEWSISSKSTRAKVKATTKERYGYEHHNQNAEVAERASKTAYKAKNYTLPSGNVIRLQGYEPFCMDELLTITTEDDIVTSRKEVPEIWYELNGKKHRYYVDIYMKSTKLCFEVKSTWTIRRDEKKIAAIREATKKMGIKYRVVVYNPKGKRVQLIKK